MQNEFEKRVQQKLEELDLVPSAPVWPRIEEQIRPKKDRRRLIFWLPLFLLLALGGWWLMKGQGENKVQARQGAPVETNPVSPANPRPSKPQPAATATSTPDMDAMPLSTGSAVPATSKASGPTTVLLASNTPPSRGVQTKARIRVNPAPTAAVQAGQDLPPSADANAVRTGAPENPVVAQEGATVSQVKDSSAKTPQAAAVDSVVQKAPAVQKKTAARKLLRKWELGLFGSIGQARYAEPLAFFGGMKSADMTPASQPNVGSSLGNRYYEEAAARPGLAAGAGIVIKKSLGRNVKFTTGLQWDFYSTTQAVGKVADSASGLYNYLNQYSQSSASVNDYRNVFHFLSLPLAIEWKPANKLPVSLQAGVAVQQLLFTNALSYNYGGQYYYYDPSSFTRTQVVGKLGLNAELRLSGRQVHIGPQLQYSFSKLYKDTQKSHLLAYGLQVQWMLKK